MGLKTIQWLSQLSAVSVEMGCAGAPTGKLADNLMLQSQVLGHPLQSQIPMNTKLLAITQPIFTLILFFRKSRFVLFQSECRNEPKHRAHH